MTVETRRYAPPFEAFVAPARARRQIWRLLLGAILCAVIYIGFISALLAGIGLVFGAQTGRRLLLDITAAASPQATLFLLFSFLGVAIGPMLAARLLHKRSVGSLFGRAATVIRHFVIATVLVGLVYGVALAVWALRFDAVPQTDPLLWLQLLPFALLGLLLQTGAEELVFRGYLQQQLAARFRSPIIWLILPSLLFGMLHYDPVTSGGNVWLIVVTTGMFGLVAADLTAATGSLGAAWGVHFANNAAAILFIAVDGTIEGLALFTTPYTADDTNLLGGLMLTDLAMLVVAWTLVRRVLRG